ncbi:MAG: pyridoxine 5'-phosphate synthase [Chlamydiota bacterium]|nr:pyridoxine 5'-phosphate synthase [Chlamydiota bacterium]
MIRLGVNIDHIATLRQARREREPDPVWAAVLCELAGSHNITVHLREDRRHIQERDLRVLRETIRTSLNLEMANVEDVVRIALEVVPDQVTMVPERREEITTEGGLDVVREEDKLKNTILILSQKIRKLGLFVDPIASQIEAAKRVGVSHIELHTGAFANANGTEQAKKTLEALIEGARIAHSLGLHVHAGHGIHYMNAHRIRTIPYLEEVNIGHAIISRAIFVGLGPAVREMLTLLQQDTLSAAHG